MFTFSGGHGAGLKALHDSCHIHLSEFVRQQSDGWQTILALESDLTLWMNALEGRPETAQYQAAHRDLGLAIYAVATGLYRQGFAGLRAFIEVSFGAIHLSAAEFERRKWVSGRKDLSWAGITSPDSGVYSRAYLQEFQPAAVDEAQELLDDLKVAYRRCSEYLHGNVATTALLPPSIEYASEPITEWKMVAKKALQALHHSMFVRYHADMSDRQRSIVESALEQHLSHFVSVRSVLGLPVEEV